MCLVVLSGIYFCCDAVLTGRQGSLLDGQGLESAYLQHGCFGFVTSGKMIHQSWNLLNDCDWNCHAHTLDPHEVGAL